MEKVVLRRPGRILAGHLWIFSNELAVSPKKFEPGSIVEVCDNKNNFIGIGYINPQSLISIRLLTRQKEKITPVFFRKRITDAINYRKRFLPNTDSYRVIFSEGDFLPGLIVDKYAECLAIQLLTLGMQKMSDMILNLLDEILSPSIMILKNDSPSRTLEGLILENRMLKGAFSDLPLIITEDGIRYEINPMSGQKTGFFLDQRENRIAFSRYINSGRGLDLFCYSGAWGLHLAKNGAFVTGVDDSHAAISQAEKNAELNNLEGHIEFVKADVFNFLKKEAETGNSYDFIVLDPPAFVKSRAKVKEALRGYREINSLSMKVIKKGGLLASSSCSYHIEKDAFADMLRSAARDSGKNARILELRLQAKDHPVLLSVPETEYLKCAIIELT